LAWAVLLCVSCARDQKPPLPIAQLPPAPENPEVLIGPGDELDIRFRYWPDLNEVQTVRPDGKISLQIIDEVDVKGLTSAQLDQKLTELYASQLKDPDVTVILRALRNQQIYVGGEVNDPGIIYLLTSLRDEPRTPGTASVSPSGKLSLWEAIVAAGGFNMSSAEMRNVVVIRTIEGKTYSTMVDLRQVLENPETEPFFLAPNDVVFVPKTRISDLNQWVEQYIEEMVPSTSFNFSYPMGRGTFGYDNSPH